MEIELADAVAAVRTELLEAAARGTGKDVVFAVGQIVLEFEVHLRADETTKTGLKAWVLSADAERTSERGSSHRVSIALTPRTVKDEDVLIHGRHEPDESSEEYRKVTPRIGR
jgi:hypothetical protein